MGGSGDPRRSNGGEAPSRVTRSLVLWLSVLLVLMGVLALGSAVAAAPTGPRLAVVVSHPYLLLSEVETVGPTGAEPARLVGGEGEGVTHPNGDRVAWSPDGTQLAFTGSFGEHSPVIYVAPAAGGRSRLVSKAGPLADPIFSPDGRELVFSSLRVIKGHFDRTARPADDEYGVVVDWAVLAVAVRNGSIRRLTPWRRHQILTPTSFSARRLEAGGGAGHAQRGRRRRDRAEERADDRVGPRRRRTRLLSGRLPGRFRAHPPRPPLRTGLL
jgi:dipeptidyl aminopeptidase/acylaminoacyl peptidase